MFFVAAIRPSKAVLNRQSDGFNFLIFTDISNTIVTLEHTHKPPKESLPYIRYTYTLVLPQSGYTVCNQSIGLLTLLQYFLYWHLYLIALLCVAFICCPISTSIFSYWATYFSLLWDAGSFGGGAVLAVQGSGFDPDVSTVTICGEACDVHRNMSTSSRLYCMSPSIKSELRIIHRDTYRFFSFIYLFIVLWYYYGKHNIQYLTFLHIRKKLLYSTYSNPQF